MKYTYFNQHLLLTQPLKHGDYVEFAENLVYEVRINHLANRKGGMFNDVVFSLAGCRESKYDYAGKHYWPGTGKVRREGAWPCFDDDQYDQATQLVLALFDDLPAPRCVYPVWGPGVTYAV
jgi:hypothetical protein